LEDRRRRGLTQAAGTMERAATAQPRALKASPLVIVPVVNVREVRMAVSQVHLSVPVEVRLARGLAPVMDVLAVPVVHVAMRLHHGVMLMLVSLREVQPDADSHQHTRQQEPWRVFDIRDPYHPKEVAYYKPGAVGSASRPGSTLNARGNRTYDYSSSNIRFVKVNGENYLWFTSHDNGFQIVKFTGHLENLAPGLFE
jgi:hypothetical protein